MRFFAVFLAVSLTACATQPISIYQASVVPSSRILAPQLLSQAQYTGTLIIKRDTGFMGSACTIRVFVDAVPVADLAPSEKVELFVPLGEHVVGATPTDTFSQARSKSVLDLPQHNPILQSRDMSIVGVKE